jgi:hypothetical protein
MKTLITLFSKLFKTGKFTTEMTDEQLDAWIVSIRQKPELVGSPITVYPSKPISNNDDLEEAGCLVLA